MTGNTNDTLTLALDGEVSLGDFAAAMEHLQNLVVALTAETETDEGVLWVIDALSAGSAVATARGIPQRDDAQVTVERVVGQFLDVGRALERGSLLQFSPRVQREARGIANVIDRVEAIRFETAVDEAVLTSGGLEAVGRALTTPPPRRHRARGAVRGRVQTLSSRGGLRFTLYDALNNRAVSCYLSEGQQDQMRNAWDQAAVVEGMVTRDPDGRPLSVRDVTAVRLLEEAGPEGYLRARGAAPPGVAAPSPEDAIRRLRDAG